MIQKINIYLLSFLYILSGVLHFYNSDFYLPMMPDFIPLHLELILISGAFEFIFGIGVLIDKTRIYSLWGIIGLLILFMSVHLNMFTTGNNLGIPTYLLIIRVIFQFSLIYWAWKNISLHKN